MSSSDDDRGIRKVGHCHECENEWTSDDPSEDPGLICPECNSEFIEILERSNHPSSPEFLDSDDFVNRIFGAPEQFSPGPPGQHPFQHLFSPPRNPSQQGNQMQWRRTGPNSASLTGTFRAGSDTATLGNPNLLIGSVMSMLASSLASGQQPRQGAGGSNTRSYSYSIPNGRATFSYRTTTIGPRDLNNPGTPTPPLDDYNHMFGLGPDQRNAASQADHAANIANLLNLLFGGVHGGAPGDVARSQEEFDRIMSELMDQSGRAAPGPASADAISTLPRRTVDQDMIGDTGKAECTICMDEVNLGDVVTELYCKHWFHTQCITVWLNEHDTCPHCRKGIEKAKEEAEEAAAKARSAENPFSARRPSSSNPNNINPPHPGPSTSTHLPRRSSRNRSTPHDYYNSPMDREYPSRPRSGRSTPPSLSRRQTTSRERPTSSSHNDLPTLPRRSSNQPRRSSGSPRDRFPTESYLERDRERERERDYSYRDVAPDPGVFRPGAYVRERERERERERGYEGDYERERDYERHSSSRSIPTQRRHVERERERRRGSDDRSYGRGRDGGQEDRDRNSTGIFDRAKNWWRGNHS